MPPSAVILTALPVEYKTVREHLVSLKEEVHPKGNVYEKGIFSVNGRSIEVGIVQLRKGNVRAGIQTERAITHFKPNYVFFVGVAGGVKDVSLGDVVAADKVYGYESGKAGSLFCARPEMGIPSFGLIERAQAEARKTDWLQRIKGDDIKPSPIASIGPIAAGEKVISSKRSITFQFLKANYGDTLAVEMEGHGFLEAVHANRGVAALVIRGISDLISGKSTSDRAGWQDKASRHAAAFTFEILAKLISAREIDTAPEIPNDLKALTDQGEMLINLGQYEEARAISQKALELGASYENDIGVGRAKFLLGIVRYEWDKNSNSARDLLKESLALFKRAKLDNDIANALFRIGYLEIGEGNLDEAKAFLSEALELDKKGSDSVRIAQDIHQLGWLEDRRGRTKEALDLYDEALTFFLNGYNDADSEKEEKRAMQGMAGCYHHKALIFAALGRIADAEANYVKALEWMRKTAFMPDTARILYVLAELKYREAQYEAGDLYLDEAIQIYRNLKDHSWHSRCLQLKGRVFFTINQPDKAILLFKSALKEAKSSGDYEQEERILSTLGDAHTESKEFDKAKGYFEEARTISLHAGLLDGYATAVKHLARIAQLEDRREDRDSLLQDGIKTFTKLLSTVQAEPRRAFITGQIGFLYEKLENFQQALLHYQRAKRAYDALGDVGGIADCLDSIARMKGRLGRKEEESDTYLELKKLVGGSPYYGLIAAAAANLGNIYMDKGDLEKAKHLLQEADTLCKQYNLRHLSDVRGLMKRLSKLMELRQPAEKNFEQLLTELFELTEWFPEAKGSIFRLWMNGRTDTLFSLIQQTVGIKFMVCQDDVETFISASAALSAFSSLCLQVVSSEYPAPGMDMVPFPPDKNPFFECSLGIGTQYTMTSSMATSKVTGNVGVIIMGISRGLPDQAYDLILSRSLAELLAQKIFFLPYQRHLHKLEDDLTLSKDFGLIPVFFGSLPSSKSIDIAASITIDFPSLSSDECVLYKKELRKAKHALSLLLTSSREGMLSSLNNVQYAVEELAENCSKSQTVQLHLIWFPAKFEKECQIVLVLPDY